MSVATIQSVISAWRPFSRERDNAARLGDPFARAKDFRAADSVARDKVRLSPITDMEGYADEQIRGLVRQVFLSGWLKPIRKVVFSAVSDETNIAGLSARIATALAAEVPVDVCLVGSNSREGLVQETGNEAQFRRSGFRQSSGRISSNLWTVPLETLWKSAPDGSSSLSRQLETLNCEFEFTVIQGPAAGTHRRAALLGQLCDGLVLVLEANSTRRVAAQRAKELLSSVGVQVLGAVLCDRDFPIPEAIYRRL